MPRIKYSNSAKLKINNLELIFNYEIEKNNILLFTWNIARVATGSTAEMSDPKAKLSTKLRG